MVLISGDSGAGKSTFADCLEERLSHLYRGEVRRFAFADELKSIAKYDFDWDGQKDERGRRLLQMLGSAGREYNEHFWRDKLAKKVVRLLFLNDGVVIVDDCRYENELSCLDNISNIHVIKVRILRQDNPNHLKGRAADHSSEHGLDCVPFNSFDFVIENTSLSDLVEGAGEVVESIWRRMVVS